MLNRIKSNFPRNSWAETLAEILILILLYVNGKFGMVYAVAVSIRAGKTPAAGDFIWTALVVVFVPLFLINVSRVALGLLFALGWLILAVYDLGSKTQVMDLKVPDPINMTVFGALGWGVFLFILPTVVGFAGGLLKKVAEADEEAPAGGGGHDDPAPGDGGGGHDQKAGFPWITTAAVVLVLLLVFGPLVYFGIYGPKTPGVGADVRATPTPTVSPPPASQGGGTGAGAAAGGMVDWAKDQLAWVASWFKDPPAQSENKPKGEYCTKTVQISEDGWWVRQGGCLTGAVSFGRSPQGPWKNMDLDGEVYRSKQITPWGMLCLKTASAVYCNIDAGSRAGVFSFTKQ